MVLRVTMASLLVVVGVVGYLTISWMSGWNDFSDSMVLRRAAILVLCLEGALGLTLLAFRADRAMVKTCAFMLVLVPVSVPVFELAYVRRRRRLLVHALERGHELPPGVQPEEVRRWAEAHPALLRRTRR